MLATTHPIPDARDATIEEDFDRLASRLAEEAELEFEEICRRANHRLEEVFGYAIDQGGPVELRLEQLGG
jgi:hypothetical protein